MKRLQLFEFEDLPWFPGALRECMTNYLAGVHRFVGTSELLRPLLARALAESDSHAIVDLCSGGGGPLPTIAGELLGPGGGVMSVTLTDRYPNLTAARAINAGYTAIRYLEASVDATAVPGDLVGLRMMIGSFHHMAPVVAHAILADALKSRRPIVVYELSDNAAPIALWWLAVPFNAVVALLATPFVRPFSLVGLVFTYVIPILPFTIAWDGAVSNARTYTPDDLRELTTDLQSPDYTWEIGLTTKKGYPGNACYLIGLPTKPV